MEPRERIIQACESLIKENGFRGFSMNVLSAQAGVSKRTLYRYFPSKDAVIESCLDSFMQSMVQIVDELVSQENDPFKLINAIFASLFTRGNFVLNARSMDELRLFYPHLWMKIDQFRMERIRHIFASFSSMDSLGLFNDIDPRIALAVISSSIQAILNPDFLLGHSITFEEAALQLSQVLLTAFITPPDSPPQKMSIIDIL